MTEITEEVKKKVLTESQQEALNNMLSFVNNEHEYTFNLSGYSGTGKSTIVQFFINALPHKRIIACTPTHRANKVLSLMLLEGTTRNIEVKTVASLFGIRYNPVSGKYENKVLDDNALTPNSILLVDECGMINSKDFMNIVENCIDRSIKMVFIGDIAQIPPIGSDSVSLSFTDCDNQHQLFQLMRQNPSNPLTKIYTILRDNMLVKHKFVTKLNEHGEGLEIIENKGQFLGAIEHFFSSEEFKKDGSYCKIICFRNIMIREYNDYVRQLTLGDATQQYQVGEILTGYKQIASSNIINNSEDYIIIKNDGIVKHSFYGKTTEKNMSLINSKKFVKNILNSKKFELQSYCLTICPVQSTTSYGIKIYLPLLEEPSNQEFFQNLYELSYAQSKERNSNMKNELYRALVDVFTNIQLTESLFLYDGKCTSLIKVKKEQPELFEVDDTGFSEFFRIKEEGLGFELDKNIDYGYAVSCHKV